MADKKAQTAESVLAAHEEELLAIEGVVGLGLRTRPDGTPCLALYVSQDTSELRRRIPKTVDSLPTEVIESGDFVAQT